MAKEKPAERWAFDNEFLGFCTKEYGFCILYRAKCIAIITDILRDEAGKVQMIEVSECTLPVCRSTFFTPEEFRGYWYERDFEIYRKGDIENIKYTASPFVKIEADPERGITGDPELPEVKINKDILPDQGNKTNYGKNQEVVLDILRGDWDSVEITSETGEKEILSVYDDSAVIPLRSDSHASGFYSARAISKDGVKKSASVEYAITALTISMENTLMNSEEPTAPAEISMNRILNVYFSNEMPNEPKMIYIQALKNAGEKNRFAITETDRENGYATIKTPDEEGIWFMFVTAENKYGEYTSNYLYFKTKAE